MPVIIILCHLPLAIVGRPFLVFTYSGLDLHDLTSVSFWDTLSCKLPTGKESLLCLYSSIYAHIYINGDMHQGMISQKQFLGTLTNHTSITIIQAH